MSSYLSSISSFCFSTFSFWIIGYLLFNASKIPSNLLKKNYSNSNNKPHVSEPPLRNIKYLLKIQVTFYILLKAKEQITDTNTQKYLNSELNQKLKKSIY